MSLNDRSCQFRKVNQISADIGIRPAQNFVWDQLFTAGAETGADFWLVNPYCKRRSPGISILDKSSVDVRHIQLLRSQQYWLSQHWHTFFAAVCFCRKVYLSVVPCRMEQVSPTNKHFFYTSRFLSIRAKLILTCSCIPMITVPYHWCNFRVTHNAPAKCHFLFR